MFSNYEHFTIAHFLYVFAPFFPTFPHFLPLFTMFLPIFIVFFVPILGKIFSEYAYF